MNKTNGADIVFRAVPGMTPEWLQRIVDCHLARAAAVGHDMPEMSYCALMLKNVTGQVTSTGNGFAVAVTSQDPDRCRRSFAGRTHSLRVAEGTSLVGADHDCGRSDVAMILKAQGDASTARDDDSRAASRPNVRFVVLCAFLAIVGFFLWTEHRAHLLGALPYVLLLACPLLHLFMHGGHGRGDRSDRHRHETKL